MTFDSARTADEHMVGAGHAEGRKVFAGKGAKPAFQPIANDRSADLLGDGEADTYGRIAVISAAKLKNEPGHSDSLAAVGGEKICPFA